MATNPTATNNDAIWTLGRDDVLRRYSVDPKNGLTATQVEQARRLHPLIPLPVAGHKSLVRMLAGQFSDFLTLLLFSAALVSSLLGHFGDGIAIAIVLMLNGVIGLVQEYRAEQALESLRSKAAPKAKVIRSGAPCIIEANDLVVGDILSLSAGDSVAADGSLIELTQLKADESMLTGESMMASKQVGRLPASTALGDRRNMVFAGTLITQGHALAVITGIGMNTQIGQIAKMLATVEQQTTPLQNRLKHLSMQLTWLVGGICLVIAALYIGRAYLRAEPFQWVELFMASIGLAVAAVPEGLPTAITIALAIGAQRMATRNAIVRQLASVETLGSVNIICTDKTGTLTQNRMAVAFTKVFGAKDLATPLAQQVAVLCNNAKIAQDKQVQGSATEAAILREALAMEPSALTWPEQYPRVKEFTFTSDRKRMSTIHQIDGADVLLCKGAAEMVLAHCRFVVDDDQSEISAEARDAVGKETIELANQGFRVLGYAYKKLPANWQQYSEQELESELTFVGFVALSDPIRKEAYDAIKRCHEAGIEVIMLTGDHPGTASYIGQQLHIAATAQVATTGPELDQMSAEELSSTLRQQRVFARVSPANKLAIVNSLRGSGSVVAMTGDGINDAPSLKQADVGIAMGINGTDVTKEAAKIILGDDNFATIVAAIEEGRLVYANIQKFVRYLLTGNLAEVVVIFLAILIGLPVPLLPIHLLWINLVTDGIPALALAFSPASGKLMQQPPRQPDGPLLSRADIRAIVLRAMVFTSVCLGVFLFARSQDHSVAYARTMTVMTLAQLQLIYSLTFTNSKGLWGGRKLFRNYRLWLAVSISTLLQAAILYTPVLQRLMSVQPLNSHDVLLVTGVALLGVAIPIHGHAPSRQAAT